ncbi:MAG: alpha/beta fold hydrolase [Planctomycetales bacterium]|nr:alpha/beta fold hydrolase [Planctomycetales bacterium]
MSPFEPNPPTIEYFTASDGYRLHFRHWTAAAAPPKAQLVALHGIQSHSGWYEYSSRLLCDAGYEVFFLDRRGSGLNDVDRGHALDWTRLVNDVVQFINFIRWQAGGAIKSHRRPTVLLGVSWGGKLAAVTAARRPELIDALALLYPGLCARVRPRWDQLARLNLAESLDIRRKLVPIPLRDPTLFTGDPQWQDFIRQDTRGLHDVTVSFLLANRKLDRLVPDTPAAIRCPVLMMLAGRDRIINNEATRRYFDRLTTATKQLIEYPAAQHTLEFEPHRDEFITDLIHWLDNTVAPG